MFSLLIAVCFKLNGINNYTLGVEKFYALIMIYIIVYYLIHVFWDANDTIKLFHIFFTSIKLKNFKIKQLILI